MDNKEYEAIKKIMDNPELADEMEKVSPGIKAQMAGYLARSWLPAGIMRKMLMLIIALISIMTAELYQNNSFYWLLLLLPMFSLRIVGETANFLGKFSQK